MEEITAMYKAQLAVDLLFENQHTLLYKNTVRFFI
jgi:hypothetical protein